MNKEYSRSDRVAQLLSRSIATIIRGEINDPRVAQLTVIEVEASRDLRHADVFVVGKNSADQKAIDESMKSLVKAGKFIRHRCMKTLELRRCPELHFKYDYSIQNGAKMSALIDSVVIKDTAED